MPVQFFFQARDAAKFFQRTAVVGLEHFFLLNRGHVVDRDFHAVHRAENAASHFVQGLGELFDLGQGFAEQLVKTRAERGIVGGDRGQHTGMIEGTIEPALQLAHPRNNAGVDERVEIAIAGNLFPQGIEVSQQLHMLFGQRGHVAIGKNFDQGNLERRERQRSVQPVAALLPLAGDTGMAVKKSCNEIGFVAVDFAGLAALYKVAKQSLGHFGIRVRSERLAHHRGRDGHIQQIQPAIHPGESFRKVSFRVTERDLIEPARNRHITAERVSQQLLIEALDCCQDR
jgi:hypothetical protein